MQKNITTLKLSKETKNRLERLKEHPRETSDQLLKKILWILSMARHEPDKAEEVLNRIDDLRKHWVKPRKQEKKDG